MFWQTVVFVDHRFDPLVSCFFPSRVMLIFKMKQLTALFLTNPTPLPPPGGAEKDCRNPHLCLDSGFQTVPPGSFLEKQISAPHPDLLSLGSEGVAPSGLYLTRLWMIFLKSDTSFSSLKICHPWTTRKLWACFQEPNHPDQNAFFCFSDGLIYICNVISYFACREADGIWNLPVLLRIWSVSVVRANAWLVAVACYCKLGGGTLSELLFK